MPKTTKAITPDKEVAVIETAVSPIVTKAQSLSITNEKTLTTATIMLSELNTYNDRITAEKEKITKPLNEALKAERGRWKPIETTLNEAINTIRDKMSDYQTQETNRKNEEEAKIASRIAPGKGNLSMETASKRMEAIAVPVAKVETTAGVLKFRPTQTLKVTNLALIPDMYFDLNEASVLKALKEGKLVPGAVIEIIQVPINYR